MPELMDLNEFSMQSLSRRPNRAMLLEANYTSGNIDNTMNQPLRYKAIEFVKATNIYDPSKDLIDQLHKLKKDDFLEELKNLDMESEHELLDEAKQDPVITSQLRQRAASDAEVSEKSDTALDKESKADPDESKPIDIKETSDTNGQNDSLDSGARLSPHEVVDVAHDSSRESTDDEIFLEETSPTRPDNEDAGLKCKLQPEEKTRRSHKASAPVEFVIDDKGDLTYLEEENVQKEATFSLLQKKVRSEKALDATEHEPYIAVGNVLLSTHTDSAGHVTATFPKAAHYTNRRRRVDKLTEDGEFQGHEGFEDYGDLEISDDSATLDFESYMNEVMGDQYRFHESDEDEEGDIIYDYGENGVSYTGPREPGTSEEGSDSDDYDVYVSSDASEESRLQDESNLNSDEDGLEDILEFARRLQRSRNPIELQASGPPKKIGKGRKQKLDLSDDLDIELRASLMEQFQYQKQARRQKKIMKKEKKIEEGIEAQDLLLKYDYSIHIQEIREEFEIFLHNASKETLSFPPLDGHGNKTISKIAGHYNMKSAKCGNNGLHQYIKVSKTKKTFRYLPAYDQVGYIMKQRPIFKRTDVKRRTRDEINETDAKKDRPRRGPRNEALVNEGDVVGGKAPEIAHLNIGRKLLEKLGWTKGEGLGAIGNKGISEPLTATVKKSKTGLK